MYRKTTTQPRKRHPLLSFFAYTLAVLLLLATTLLTIFALHIYEHPEQFKIDLSLFGTPTNLSSGLYCFPDGDFTLSLDNAVPMNDTLSIESSLYVPLTEIPTSLRNAFIAIEDKRFYQHHGVDLRRTASAILHYLLSSERGFGGSTITQQLVKNVTGDNERTIFRKVAEIFRSIDLEAHLSKDEILEKYLNIIHLAGNYRGVGAASKGYFGKSVKELSLAECASIAAITQNPSRYHPRKHPEENKKRRDLILREMLSQGYILRAEYETAVSAPVLTVEPETKEANVHSWYTDLVIEDVIADLVDQHSYARSEASHLLYYGGLKIYTLMHPSLQKLLEDYYTNEAHFEKLSDGTSPQSGMIILDPHTGNILAVAGAIGEKKADRLRSFATDALRSPGSALKPLSVFAPAIHMGKVHCGSVLDDVPVDFPTKNGIRIPWPQNANGTYRGKITVKDALTHSTNTIAVRLLSLVGKEESFRFLRDTLHLTSLEDSDLGPAALALGQLSHGVTLREITAAYTIFTDKGNYHTPRSYALVTDASGRILLDNSESVQNAISAETAEAMTAMLKNVVDEGTAKSLNLKHLCDTAGKTGTTQYNYDKYFIGYTPYLLAGVWYGCEYPRDLTEIKGNPALRIFDEVMIAAHLGKAYPQTDKTDRHFSFMRLREVTLCRDSGYLISDACTLDPRGNREVTVLLPESLIPKSFCTCHRIVIYDGDPSLPESGIASSLCPTEGQHKTALITAERSFPIQVTVIDAQFTLPQKNNENAKIYHGISNSPLQYHRICTTHQRKKQKLPPSWYN